jgi:hypothetical protein
VKHGIISVEDQRFIAEVNQHRMVLIVEPATEDIEATVLWPSRGIGEPTITFAAVNWLIVRKSNQVSDPGPAPTPK